MNEINKSPLSYGDLAKECWYNSIEELIKALGAWGRAIFDLGEAGCRAILGILSAVNTNNYNKKHPNNRKKHDKQRPQIRGNLKEAISEAIEGGGHTLNFLKELVSGAYYAVKSVWEQHTFSTQTPSVQ